MGPDDFKLLWHEDDQLALDVPVEVRWTNSGNHYKADGVVSKVNAKTVRVRLTHGIAGSYPAGQEIRVPRITDIKNWTWGNHVRLRRPELSAGA